MWEQFGKEPGIGSKTGNQHDWWSVTVHLVVDIDASNLGE
jgi:hypothetical protein